MDTKTVIVTRPQDESDALTEMLHEHGYRVIHEPLTRVFLRHTVQPDVARAVSADPDAVIVTSRHGVHALAALTEMRDLSLLCVGEGTAKAAASVGFDRVRVTGGNVHQLLEHVLSSYDQGARFFYPSAEHVRMDVAGALIRQGMQAERLVVYEAVAAQRFSDTFLEQLKRQPMDAALFLSQRVAQIFVTLLAKNKLEDSLADMQACAMSDTIAGALKDAPWQGVHVAQQPTLASLVACVDNALSEQDKDQA